TAAQMAQLAGASEATVIRFATYLGFSGFSEMQNHLREEIRERLTTVERLDMAEDAYPEEQRGVYEVLHDDLGNLQQTRSEERRVGRESRWARWPEWGGSVR